MNELIQNLEDALFVKIYGEPAFEFPLDKAKRYVLDAAGLGDGAAHLIRVVALGSSIGSGCLEVAPFLLIVSGPPAEPDCKDVGGHNVKMWTVKRSASSIRLDTVVGSVDDLIADAGPLDLKLKGGISATLKTDQDGKVCVHWSASIKLQARVFGGGWNTVASLSEGGDECITYNTCVTVINAGVFQGDLCYTASNRQLCLKVKAGYHGASVKATFCTTV